ncbi:MAG: hypothetical protein R3213_11365 [Flavobacteriaceae bacterium]|nr:hypothetical protein [Flavobacteriaceae bacterium]
MKIADIVKDKQLLGSARFYAKKLIKEDPNLSSEKNLPIKRTYKALTKYKNIWNYIS